MHVEVSPSLQGIPEPGCRRRCAGYPARSSAMLISAQRQSRTLCEGDVPLSSLCANISVKYDTLTRAGGFLRPSDVGVHGALHTKQAVYLVGRGARHGMSKHRPQSLLWRCKRSRDDPEISIRVTLGFGSVY